MDPYEGLDSWLVRNLFFDEIVDYANEYIQKMSKLEEVEQLK